jgi:hypothetical protein
LLVQVVQKAESRVREAAHLVEALGGEAGLDWVGFGREGLCEAGLGMR